MKTMLCALLVVLVVAGCSGTLPVNVETVSKPIPMCAPPPDVPDIEYQVDKLTPSDSDNPGLVAYAYKYDTYAMRAQIKVYKMILEEYTKTSQTFEAVTEEINKLFINAKTNPTPHVKDKQP